MSLKKIALLLAMALTGAAVFAGCGSDDSSDSDSEPLTKTEFIAQADEICQGSIDVITEQTADFNADTPDDELVAFAEDDYVPELRDELAELQELTPPEEDQDTYDEMLTALEEGIDSVEADPEMILEEGAEPLAEATAKAGELDLEVCGAS